MPPRTGTTGGRIPTDRAATLRAVSADRDNAIYGAVFSLLGEVGYDRMSMDAVAARAQVSKATLYRRWPGKPELVVEALRQRHSQVQMPPDTGSLRGDLIELLRATAVICVADAGLMQTLGTAMRDNPELAQLVRQQVMPAGRVNSVAVLLRAAARGDLAPEAAGRDLFHDLAPALVMSRVLAHGRPVDDAFLARVVDQVLIPVLTHRDPPAAEPAHSDLDSD